MSTESVYRDQVYEKYASVSGLAQFLPAKYLSFKHNLSSHLLAAANRGTILEIGSGQGELLMLCKDLGLTAEGVDISKELADSCNARGLKVTLTTDLYEYLGTRSDLVYEVVMVDVLEHFTRAEALGLLRLVQTHCLQPGGRMIIQVPNMASPFAALNFYHDITHEWSYTEASIRQLFLNAGFQRVQVLPSNYPLMGLYAVRHILRTLFYLFVRLLMMIDQPNRSKVLTPNLIAIAYA